METKPVRCISSLRLTRAPTVILAGLVIAAAACSDPEPVAVPPPETGSDYLRLDEMFESELFVEATFADGRSKSVGSRRLVRWRAADPLPQPLAELLPHGLVSLVELRTRAGASDRVYLSSSVSMSAVRGDDGGMRVVFHREVEFPAVQVRVISDSGEPVPAARISMRPTRGASQPEAPRTETTDARGCVTYSAVADGSYEVTLGGGSPFAQRREYAHDSSRAVAGRVTVDSARQALSTLELRARRGGEVALIVPPPGLSADHARSAGARFEFMRRYEDGIWRSLPAAPEVTDVRSTHEGGTEARVVGLPVGDYRIYAHLPPSAYVRAPATVEGGATTKVVFQSARRVGDLTISRPTDGTESGKRLGLRLNPVGGQWASVRSAGIEDAESQVTVRDLASGRYMLIMVRLQLATPVTITGEAHGISISTPTAYLRDGTSSLKLRATRLGEPLEMRRACVVLYPYTPGGRLVDGTLMRFCRTLPAEFDSLPPGRYTVAIVDDVLGTDIPEIDQFLSMPVDVGPQPTQATFVIERE